MPLKFYFTVLIPVKTRTYLTLLASRVEAKNFFVAHVGIKIWWAYIKILRHQISDSIIVRQGKTFLRNLAMSVSL